MKIRFKIQGIHCDGCVNLIKLTMEDYGFKDIEIDKVTNTATALTDKTALDEVTSDVKKAFEEMSKYTVSDIEKVG